MFADELTARRQAGDCHGWSVPQVQTRSCKVHACGLVELCKYGFSVTSLGHGGSQGVVCGEGGGRFLDADSSSVWGIAFSPKKNVRDQVLFHAGFFVCFCCCLLVLILKMFFVWLLACTASFLFQALLELSVSLIFFIFILFFGFFCALCKSAFHYNFSFAPTNTEGSSAEAK